MRNLSLFICFVLTTLSGCKHAQHERQDAKLKALLERKDMLLQARYFPEASINLPSPETDHTDGGVSSTSTPGTIVTAPVIVEATNADAKQRGVVINLREWNWHLRSSAGNRDGEENTGSATLDEDEVKDLVEGISRFQKTKKDWASPPATRTALLFSAQDGLTVGMNSVSRDVMLTVGKASTKLTDDQLETLRNSLESAATILDKD